MRRILRRSLLFLVLLSALLLRALIDVPTKAPAGGDQSAEKAYPVSSSWPAGIQAFLRLETSSPVYNMLYRYGRIDAALNGAYGPNTTAPPARWYLEYQRAGGTDVIAGVLRGDRSMIAEGLRIFHFGLARETSRGSFPGSIWPFHGTAMFLAEVAPALIVLKYSRMAGAYQDELRWQVDRVHRAARYIVRQIGGPGRIDDRTKNHRFYEAALALGSSGVLTGDSQLGRWSTLYAWTGVRMERPDGVMPEDGGHDTGYQALGMTYATRYLELSASGSLRQALLHALERGESWELSRVRADGTIDQTGDTRTAGCKERDPQGQCKTTFYAPIFDALARWGVVRGDQRLVRAAYRVWLQNWRLVPGDVLPHAGLWADPSEIQRGQWLTVHGAGFQPLEIVHIYFDGNLEQTLGCDQIGSFGGHSPQPNAHFPLPGAASGRHTITARGSFGTVRHTAVTVTD